MFDRCSPDMSSGQEMTSVEQESLLRVSMFRNVMVGITRSKVILFSARYPDLMSDLSVKRTVPSMTADRRRYNPDILVVGAPVHSTCD